MCTAGDGHQADQEFRAPGMESAPPGYEFTPVGLKGPKSEEKDSRRWLLKRVVAVAALGIVWDRAPCGTANVPGGACAPAAHHDTGPHGRCGHCGACSLPHRQPGAHADADAHTGAHAHTGERYGEYQLSKSLYYAHPCGQQRCGFSCLAAPLTIRCRYILS